ncbi:MAG TPA: TIM barrel protein [Bacillales bacterium]|nr:TIM barrel protein [Bacillales bacterium]
MKLGCHANIRKGYYRAALYAHSIGARAFQFFPKNPRSLQIKRHDRNEASRCAQYCRRHGIVSLAHAPYPTTIAAEDKETRTIVAESILNDLEIVEDSGSIGLVVHFGSRKRQQVLKAYKTIIETLNEVLGRWKGKSLLLIENTAGKSSEMGTTFRHPIRSGEKGFHSFWKPRLHRL